MAPSGSAEPDISYAGDAEYDQHVHQHGRRHRSQDDYLERRAIFQDNLRFIQVTDCRQHALALG